MLCRSDRIAWNPECTRKRARATAGNAADRRRLRAKPVHDLVEPPVPRVDEERIDVVRELPRELGRVPAPLGQMDPDLRGPRERPLDERDPMLVDGTGERIDDQRDVGHTWRRPRQGVAYPRIPSSKEPKKRSASASVSWPGRS